MHGIYTEVFSFVVFVVFLSLRMSAKPFSARYGSEGEIKERGFIDYLSPVRLMGCTFPYQLSSVPFEGPDTR